MPYRKKDLISFDPATSRVTVVKVNGNTYLIASYDNAHRTHKRGAKVIGDLPSFWVSQETKAAVLKHFYPDDSLRYLKQYGYIAS